MAARSARTPRVNRSAPNPAKAGTSASPCVSTMTRLVHSWRTYDHRRRASTISTLVRGESDEDRQIGQREEEPVAARKKVTSKLDHQERQTADRDTRSGPSVRVAKQQPGRLVRPISSCSIEANGRSALRRRRGWFVGTPRASIACRSCTGSSR